MYLHTNYVSSSIGSNSVDSVTLLLETAVIINEPVHEKTNNLGSDQVLHKLGCTVTEDG